MDKNKKESATLNTLKSLRDSLALQGLFGTKRKVMAEVEKNKKDMEEKERKENFKNRFNPRK